MMENLYGLIGYPLSHSFSKKYFTRKFEQECIANSRYELFELKSINELPGLLTQYPAIKGLNVTIPYKQQVMHYIDDLDSIAEQVGAVNTIKLNAQNKKRIGYNTDYYGFKVSLESWIGGLSGIKALVLGTGGASKAVKCALNNSGIAYMMISRTASENTLSYDQLRENYHLKDYHLIINTTPLGMSPHVDTYPDLDYQQMTSHHFCYDLVYNPEQTQFMKLSASRSASVKNGLEMLHLQAEKSWEIWNS